MAKKAAEAKEKAGAKGRARRGRMHLTVNRPELLVDQSDQVFRQFVHNALAFAARLLAVRDGYGKIMGISGPQYTILISVAHLGQDGLVSVRDVADHLHLSGSFVTNETKKLVNLGLLEKQSDAEDRRKVNLVITAAGWKRLDELSEVQSQVNDIHFSSLTRKQFDELCKVTPELVASTDRALSLLQHLSGSKR